jgi:hypothetical protein
MSRFTLIVAALGLLAACSGSVSGVAASLQHAQTQAACASAGLDPSEAPYVYCVMSLEQSGAALPAGGRAVPAPAPAIGTPYNQAETACGNLGFAPASAGYANCVGNLDQTLEDAQRVGTD